MPLAWLYNAVSIANWSWAESSLAADSSESKLICLYKKEAIYLRASNPVNNSNTSNAVSTQPPIDVVSMPFNKPEITRIFQSTAFFDTSNKFAASNAPVIPPIVANAISASIAVLTAAADLTLCLAAFSANSFWIFLPSLVPLISSTEAEVNFLTASSTQFLRALITWPALVPATLSTIFFTDALLGIPLITLIIFFKKPSDSLAANLATSSIPEPAVFPAAFNNALVADSAVSSAASDTPFLVILLIKFWIKLPPDLVAAFWAASTVALLTNFFVVASIHLPLAFWINFCPLSVINSFTLFSATVFAVFPVTLLKIDLTPLPIVSTNFPPSLAPPAAPATVPAPGITDPRIPPVMPPNPLPIQRAALPTSLAALRPLPVATFIPNLAPIWATLLRTPCFVLVWSLPLSST